MQVEAPDVSTSKEGDSEVVAFLRGRSAPCPRCGHELRNLPSARCPECGEPLILTIGTPTPRFGRLVLAMVPCCFSGVAAVFVFIPVGMTIAGFFGPGQGAPWPVMAADAFGFLSAGSAVLMYRHRRRIMAWAARRQAIFVAAIWIAHVVALGLYGVAMALWA